MSLLPLYYDTGYNTPPESLPLGFSEGGGRAKKGRITKARNAVTLAFTVKDPVT